MESEKKNRRIANGYYNLGLSKARQRDLTGAIRELKKSLQFDKYQIDARNLLGLIYNEIGEVGAALAQWIISLNLQEEHNLAEEYLTRIQTSRGYLEVADQAARKYNQALNYAENENEDLASLILMRMLVEMPNFVKAQELLALLYIHKEEYTKAGKCLYHALKIDPYNPRALRYMTIVKRNTGKAEVERRKLKNAFSHRQMQDDDIIIPPTYKENTGWQMILNILSGLILGAAVIFFLVLPASREQLNRIHNEELRQNLELLNQKSIEIDSLKLQLQTAKEEKSEAETSLSSLISNSEGVVRQYQNLAKILQAFREEDMEKAVLLYVDTDFSALCDGELDSIVTAAEAELKAQGPDILEAMGDEAAGAGNHTAAADYFEKSLKIKGDEPEVLFKLANACLAQGNTDRANEHYGTIIMNYPDSEFAEQAKEKRGY